MPVPRSCFLARRALLAAGLALCTPTLAAAQERRAPLRVLATTAMIGDLTRCIGGGRVNLTVLMGEGVDPHLFKPTRQDVARLLQSDLVLYSGLMLEGQMIEAIERVGGSGRRTVAVAEALPPAALLVPEGAAGQADPHVWMDPRAWSQVAAIIAARLTESDPAGGPVFAAQLATLQAELAALDEWALRAIASIPAERRVLITAHDAFGYFARRYGIEVMGIQGLSTESEAGLRQIERLVGVLVERRIPAVFVESSVSDRNIRALVEGAMARGHEVVVGGALFSDAMGAPGTYEGTYPGMIDHNVTTIVRALGGEAPERGFAGQLSVAAR
ncbi:metal ABC transporter solute-binding protein, Zn/Mn family [Teichococcus vastitatis]|uniref:Zinc ABC transporter substrate-binding protein n=1 Tax=Teichococcus vastitatis TaxID=2307076 RepID=A0ABS9WEI8_9PROT|nr:zinc ABC transporter substrate-binding protein [Pseudoroseomonas vastitatis]MCI0757044.1 zinc ABC transporter substrate-binding protein [Pseudoroseomonas vastitatis]